MDYGQKLSVPSISRLTWKQAAKPPNMQMKMSQFCKTYTVPMSRPPPLLKFLGDIFLDLLVLSKRMLVLLSVIPMELHLASSFNSI